MDEMTKRLREVAGRIRGWQTERRMSDAELLRRYRGLGTDRTFGRIMGGDLDELDVERWAKDYEAVWQCMQMESEESTAEEPLYDDLSIVLDVRRAVAEAMREQGSSRLVLVQGPNGSGKSSSARMLQARYGARVVIAEANETWKESAGAMLSGILEALGDKTPIPSAADRLRKAVEKLSTSRTCLVIDEAHHLGPRTLNLVKTLINQTPGEIVLLAMGTLWRRLETQVYEEARQLTQDRLCERIRLEAVEIGDVEKIAQRRLGLGGGDARKAGETICQAARQVGGGLAVVKLICRKTRKLAGKEAVTAEILARAIALVVSSR
jgi:type II secretory pathway predicted ATPase ExeA